MNIVLYGGTGQCKVMRPIVDRIGKLHSIIDECIEETPFVDVPLYSSFDEWKYSGNLDKINQFGFSVTIGNPNGDKREQLSNMMIEYGMVPISLVHNTALIEKYSSIGKGCQIHNYSIINPFAKINDYCIINTKASVDHDCYLDTAVEIGPGAILCGHVEVGKYSWIGAGSVVRQKIKIGKNSIIGAGSVVVNDIPDNVVVVGNPARILKRK